MMGIRILKKTLREMGNKKTLIMFLVWFYFIRWWWWLRKKKHRESQRKLKTYWSEVKFFYSFHLCTACIGLLSLITLYDNDNDNAMKLQRLKKAFRFDDCHKLSSLWLCTSLISLSSYSLLSSLGFLSCVVVSISKKTAKFFQCKFSEKTIFSYSSM
jgi:hypothetical protein